MPSMHDQGRRALMSSLASLSVGGTAAQAAGPGGDARPAGSRVLVAYFSRSGNTRVVAGLLQRAHQAEVFEIRPAQAYPEEYLATVAQAQQERERDFKPALTARITRLGECDTLFLGFPIWGETVPSVVRSFLAAHDLAGKTLIPFITHGGYGLGDSLRVLTRLAPGARLQPGFEMQADQERQTMERVNAWLGRTPAAR